MIIVKPKLVKEPFECHGFCDWQCYCQYTKKITVDELYEEIKNPPPAPIGKVTKILKYTK